KPIDSLERAVVGNALVLQRFLHSPRRFSRPSRDFVNSDPFAHVRPAGGPGRSVNHGLKPLAGFLFSCLSASIDPLRPHLPSTGAGGSAGGLFCSRLWPIMAPSLPHIGAARVRSTSIGATACTPPKAGIVGRYLA